ncbi:hypothetical protein ABTX60_03980 [Streptomyces sp. NPDC126510]|uniref:hypothetical protein n=1 Tax=Streptomyces sp. NPDC126510 TaxID=3155317 RepID=UPI0033303FE9
MTPPTVSSTCRHRDPETGNRLARAEEDRVAAAPVLADPTIGAALHAAAEDVIDGTPEELRALPGSRAVRGRRLTRGTGG